MAKTKLSIYLVKEKITEIDDIAKQDSAVSTQDIPDLGTLLSKKSHAKVPSWVDSFFNNSIDSTHLRSSSASAVLIVPTEIDEEKSIRCFAISFGFGRNLLDMNCIEERFGLKVALSLAEDNSLRKIKRSTVAGSALKGEEQMPIKSSISDFPMDIQRDLLEGVTVSVSHEDLIEGNITGADALSISTEAEISSIKDLLKELYRIYLSNHYKKGFPWVDRINNVKSETLINRLNKEAVQLINEGSSNIWMAVPEVINWEDVDGFKIPGQGIKDDILIQDVIDSLKEPLTEYKQLQSRYIQIISAENGKATRKWSADKCLFGEVPLDDEQYCINGGKWYRVDNDFVQQINQAYDDFPISKIIFPKCGKGEKEKEYNLRFANTNRQTFALMDAKNISYGGGRSREELCDILVSDGTFIHIKHYRGSSVLSHLFNQGLVSADLVKSEKLFREEAQRVLNKSNPEFNFIITEDSISEVAFGIISKYAEERPNIPFFSKITINHVRRRLERYGIRVSIKTICQNKQ